jgi:hypothetical protein
MESVRGHASIDVFRRDFLRKPNWRIFHRLIEANACLLGRLLGQDLELINN